MRPGQRRQREETVRMTGGKPPRHQRPPVMPDQMHLLGTAGGYQGRDIADEFRRPVMPATTRPCAG